MPEDGLGQALEQEASPAPQAAEEETPASEPEAEGGGGEQAAEEEFLTQEEEREIEARASGDVAAALKAYRQRWTEKTQGLSEIRSEHERLKKESEEYQGVVSALERDPAGVLKQLMDHYKVEPEKLLGAQGGEAQDAQGAKDPAVAALEESLGENLAFMADKIAPGVQEMINAGISKGIEEALGPIKDQQGALASQARQTHLQSLVSALSKKHPDVGKYAGDIKKLHEGIVGSFGIGNGSAVNITLPYLDHLYQLASREDSLKKAGQAAVSKASKSAEAATPPPSGSAPSKPAAGKGDLDWEAAFDESFRELQEAGAIDGPALSRRFGLGE